MSGQARTPDGAGAACHPAPATRAQGFVESPLAVSRDGMALNAVLTRPATGAVRAVVVFLHGYTGNRDEIAVRGGSGMFRRAARAFAVLGIASLRFDFAGSGESDGAWADTTFAGQAADVRVVLDAVRAQPGLAGAPLHLLGYSQGGLVGLRAVAEGAPVRGMVLWNPVLDPTATYRRVFGADVLRTGMTLAGDGDPAVPVPGSRLNAGFFQGIAVADPVADGAAYSGPILIVTGDSDRIAGGGPANARAFRAARSGRTRVVRVAADHALGVSRGTGVIDRVIGCSAGFIAAQSGFGPAVPDLQ